MASRNEYIGYAVMPGKPFYEGPVRLDFNGHVNVDDKSSVLEGFTLRLFVLRRGRKGQQPEMSVTLRPEQWLDLADGMREEFDKVAALRRQMEQ